MELDISAYSQIAKTEDIKNADIILYKNGS